MSDRVSFRTRYSPRHRVALSFDPELRRTKSEFADECDINKIMARYKRTGVLPESALAAKATFGDFSQIPTFQEMQEKVAAAYELFAALPAAVRKQFDNDPGAFISAADTPQGVELLCKLGLGKEQADVASKVSSSALGAGSIEPSSAADEVSEETVPAAGAKKARTSSKNVN